MKERGFSYPLQRSMVRAYSRYLHRTKPSNPYFSERIPWRTILAAFIFLILGTFMLVVGLQEMAEKGITEAYEKICLGMILFIPGSYHSFLAV
jgi:hypothetical protein